MANCRYCGTDCPERGEHDRFFNCALYTNRIPTNADRIRSMSDEKLAEFVQTPFCDRIDGKCGGACGICTLDWLQSPAEMEGTE